MLIKLLHIGAELANLYHTCPTAIFSLVSTTFSNGSNDALMNNATYSKALSCCLPRVLWRGHKLDTKHGINLHYFNDALNLANMFRR